MLTFFAIVGLFASALTIVSFVTGKANISEILANDSFIVRPFQKKVGDKIFDRNRYLAIPVQKSSINNISSSLSANGKYFVGFDRDWYNIFSVYFCAFNFGNSELAIWRSFSIPTKFFDPYRAGMKCCWAFSHGENHLYYSRVNPDFKYRIEAISALDMNLKQQVTFDLYGKSGEAIVFISNLTIENGILSVYFSDVVNKVYLDGYLVYNDVYSHWISIQIDQDFRIVSA